MLFDLEYVEKRPIHSTHLDGKFGHKEFMWVQILWAMVIVQLWYH